MKKYTNAEYERKLNDQGVPKSKRQSNGGRIPDDCNYGSWLRKHKPEVFKKRFTKWSKGR